MTSCPLVSLYHVLSHPSLFLCPSHPLSLVILLLLFLQRGDNGYWRVLLSSAGLGWGRRTSSLSDESHCSQEVFCSEMKRKQELYDYNGAIRWNSVWSYLFSERRKIHVWATRYSVGLVWQVIKKHKFYWFCNGYRVVSPCLLIWMLWSEYTYFKRSVVLSIPKHGKLKMTTFPCVIMHSNYLKDGYVLLCREKNLKIKETKASALSLQTLQK